MAYFRLYFGEDGVSIENLTKDEVLELLNDETEDTFSKEMSDRLKLGKEIGWPENCECYRSIFIKGEVVSPIEKTVVTKYEID